jgi:type IV secretion system protein VirD4
MYQLSRWMLLACVPVYLYCAMALVILCGTLSPAVWWVLAVLALLGLARKRKRIFHALSAHGTATWADENTLRRGGMIDAGRGLILGRLCGGAKPGLPAGLKALVDPRLAARDACRQFFWALRRRPAAPVVRLPQAITSVCFAPPGAGKSTGLVIPFHLTCRESCVVIDFSGELALATAEARRRLGHEIIILDPYKVVTP